METKEVKAGVIQLSLEEVLALNEELAYLNKEKEISFVAKYKLSKLFERTSKIVKNFNEKKLALYQKYGKKVPNQPAMFTLKGSKQEKQGMKELGELINVTENFTESFSISFFENLKSETGYVQIYKFIKE